MSQIQGWRSFEFVKLAHRSEYWQTSAVKCLSFTLITASLIGFPLPLLNINNPTVHHYTARKQSITANSVWKLGWDIHLVAR